MFAIGVFNFQSELVTAVLMEYGSKSYFETEYY